jgi:hypothetical protein
VIVSPTIFVGLPKETAPRFGTWNESSKHTQKAHNTSIEMSKEVHHPTPGN